MKDYEHGPGPEPSNVVPFNRSRKARPRKGKPAPEQQLETVADMIDSATRDLHAAACTVQRMIYLARDRCGLPQL